MKRCPKKPPKSRARRRARANPKPRAWSAKGPSRAYVCKSPLVGRTVRLGRSEVVVESCATPSRRRPNQGQFRVRSKATGKSRAVPRRRVSAALYRAKHPRKMPAGLLKFWSKTREGGSGRPSVAEAYGPRESLGVGAFEEARALPYGPRASLGTGAFEERRAIARGAMPDSVEIIVGKTTTQLRRKRFDVGARVSGNYVPGMSVTVAEEHGGGSWAVAGHTYDGSKRREINYGGGLSRAAATALAEKVLRAATIERTSGGVMAVLPEPQAPVYEVQHIDRVTNAQAGRSWKGNRAPPGDEWIASSHLTIRRSAAGHMVPSHNGERRFKPWNQSLFKILDAPSTEYSQMRHQDFGGIAIPLNDRVSAQLVGWVDTGRAGTPRVATFLGEDGTAVNANADYVALIERNLGGHARPFVSRGEPLAGVQWFDHHGSMSAALMAIREEGPVAKPPPRANPSRNNRRRS